MYTNYKKFQDVSRKQAWLNEGKKNGWLKSSMLRENNFEDSSDDVEVTNNATIDELVELKLSYAKNNIDHIIDLSSKWPPYNVIVGLLYKYAIIEGNPFKWGKETPKSLKLLNDRLEKANEIIDTEMLKFLKNKGYDVEFDTELNGIRIK